MKPYKFKLFLITFFVIGMLAAIGLKPAFAGESLYQSGTISTYTVTDAAYAADIAFDRVQVQSVGVWHVVASTEMYHLYTGTTLLGYLYVPATINWYSFLGDGVFLNGNVLTGSDMIDMPNLYIRHVNQQADGTRAAADTMQVIYKK